MTVLVRRTSAGLLEALEPLAQSLDLLGEERELTRADTDLLGDAQDLLGRSAERLVIVGAHDGG